ncbi:MAG: DUF3800 domain-containing protein [Pyrinomonadaceae bacterium]
MFSDYIVFVDESGDHGMVGIDQTYPMFVLAFCVFRKPEYMETVCPAVQRFKFKHWGHDAVVLHEYDIRKPKGDYSFLKNAARRVEFFDDLTSLIEGANFTLIASVIRKADYRVQYHAPVNPYSIALEFGLERLFKHLEGEGQGEKVTHVVVERRGKREDEELELEFRRICDGANFHNQRLPFQIVMAPKASNATGMQLADLVARPIGIKTLRPNQPNRAYDVIEKKFRRSPQGFIGGWGLKSFP